MRKSDFSTIIPSFAPDTDDPGIDRLLSPARYYQHPDEVLADAALDHSEKRAILSSWASDACAVESMPAARQPPGMRAPISFDAIMDALRRLDGFGACDQAVAGNRQRQSGPRTLDA